MAFKGKEKVALVKEEKPKEKKIKKVILKKAKKPLRKLQKFN
jgi:hypothetical protein